MELLLPIICFIGYFFSNRLQGLTMAKKYRILKVGEVIPEHYEVCPKVAVIRKWVKGKHSVGHIINAADMPWTEFRVEVKQKAKK